ncbi:hypothetical protein D3C85_1525990 [compost metagenome]
MCTESHILVLLMVAMVASATAPAELSLIKAANPAATPPTARSRRPAALRWVRLAKSSALLPSLSMPSTTRSLVRSITPPGLEAMVSMKLSRWLITSAIRAFNRSIACCTLLACLVPVIR